MATIQINDKWRVSSDRYSWSCDNPKWMKNKKTGARELVWLPQTWHRTLASALRWLGERLLRDSDASSMDDFVREAEQINVVLNKAVEPARDLINVDMSRGSN